MAFRFSISSSTVVFFFWLQLFDFAFSDRADGILFQRADFERQQKVLLLTALLREFFLCTSIETASHNFGRMLVQMHMLSHSGMGRRYLKFVQQKC